MNCKLITWNENEFFINEVLFVGVVIFLTKRRIMSPPYAYALEEEITGTKLIVSLTNRLTNKDSDFLCLCIGLRTHFWLILIMGIVRFKELLIMVDTCQASTLFSQVSLILHFYHSLKILCRFLWNNSLWSWFLSVHCPELINIEVHIGVQFYSVHIFFCYLYSSSSVHTLKFNCAKC